MFGSLIPELQPWATWLYDVAQWAGLHPRVTSTYRSIAEQERLYDAYRRGEARFPAAPPGASLHNYGHAFDLVSDDNDWLGQVWESVGGRWGGRFRDPIHFDTGARIET